MIKILIVGLGRVGIRHFQSLLNFKVETQIDCIDTSKDRINEAKKIFYQNNLKINFYNNYNNIDQYYNFLILAVTADIRLIELKNILKKTKIDFCIFEKVLGQSLKELEEFKLLSKNFKSAWVNTPMNEIDLYKKLKNKIKISDVKEIYFNSFRGLACNAIHFIDFVSSWKAELPLYINTSKLEKKWKPAERKGFFEIDGILEIIYKNNFKLFLKSKVHHESYHCKIITKNRNWTITESNKTFFSDNKEEEYFGEVEPQSVLTFNIINNINKFGNCNLPNLEWSILCHSIFLDSMLNHWNSYEKEITNRLQIT